MSDPRLVQYFADHFIQGGSFTTIVAARQQAESILGQKVAPGTALAKLVDESAEAGMVRAARRIVETSATTHEAYDRLVNLHDRQPVLNVRSSTSVLQQAYSTPVPIAFLGSTLAQIDLETTVYEPSGGHGALLIRSNPIKATVNEINAERATDLRAQGFTVTENDAADYRPGKLHDRVICNPPFGMVKTGNQIRQFHLFGSRKGTTQIDQAIALLALESMKDDGRAVLILGGKLGDDEAQRSDRYNTLESRHFYAALYEQYNVTQHVSIWGALYRKQGAGFPIDLIVIEGRGQAQRSLPAADVPVIYKSFFELKELMPNERLHSASPNLETTSARRLGTIDGQGSSQKSSDHEVRIQIPTLPAHRVDAANLDGANSRNAGADSLQAHQNTAYAPVLSRISEANRPGNGSLAASVGMDGRMDGDIPRSQRNPDAETSGGFSGDINPDRFANNTNLARRTRLNQPERLASNFNPGYDHRPGLIKTPELASNGSNIMVEQPHFQDTTEALVATQSFDVPYVPRSQGRSAHNLIPVNMAVAAQTALDHLEQEVGNLDAFVRQRLGYDSEEQMWQCLYAEQIDAIALAFHQRDLGNIFLNGDKTGNGKGRFGAANLMDAARQGHILIFVTQKANLYTSMLTDLSDIGKPGFRVFATDNNLSLDLEDGRRLVTGDAASLTSNAAGSSKSDHSSVVNSTYFQLKSIP
ncbi:hypothetical protein [Phormidesmis priestleyi]